MTIVSAAISHQVKPFLIAHFTQQACLGLSVVHSLRLSRTHDASLDYPKHACREQYRRDRQHKITIESAFGTADEVDAACVHQCMSTFDPNQAV